MGIITISKENAENFYSMIPNYLLHPKSRILGYEEDGTICGVAVLEELEGVSSLSWLWIDKEKRRKGIAKALIDTLCQAHAKHKRMLTVSYPAEEPWSRVMDYLFAVRGFELRVEKISCYLVTREQLLHSMLTKRDKKTEKQEKCVMPLAKLRGYQMAELKKRYEIRSYLVSRVDFAGADKDMSMALVLDGKIEGLLLLHRMSQKGRYQLSLLFLAPDKLIWGTPFLRKAAANVLEERFGLEELEFTCVNKSAVLLAEHLFADGTKRQKLISHGILHTELQ